MSTLSNILTDYIMSSRMNYIYPQGTLPSNLFFRKTEKSPYWLANLSSPIIYCENEDIELENVFEVKEFNFLFHLDKYLNFSKFQIFLKSKVKKKVLYFI